MRGKKAKQLRRLASVIMTQRKESLGKGYNEYDQAYNRVGWVTATDANGDIMYGPDGMALRKITNDLPGTITTAWKWKQLYRELKKQWKLKHLTF